MRICLSQGGRPIFTGMEPAAQMLVGTADGIYSLERADARKWRIAWAALQGHHISSIDMDSDSGALFAGVYRGGVFASEDNGKTWQSRGRGLGSENVFSLTFVRSASGKKVYAGTEPAHLFESTDMGVTWIELRSLRDAPSLPGWTFPAPPHVAHVKFIAVDPRDTAVIYAAVEVGGLLKSCDGGATWEELQGFYEDVHRIVICRSASNSIYITTGDGLYHTGDGGRSWKRMTDLSLPIAYPDAMVVVPGQENLLFMAGARGAPGTWRKTYRADSRIGRSRDGGKTWEFSSDGLPTPMSGNVEAMSLASWQDSFELFAGTTNGDVYCSDNEGTSWSRIVAGLPPVSKSGHYQILQSA